MHSCCCNDVSTRAEITSANPSSTKRIVIGPLFLSYPSTQPAYAAIAQHSPFKPVLVFVASRRQTRLTALDLISFCCADENPYQWVHMQDQEVTSTFPTCYRSTLYYFLVYCVNSVVMTLVCAPMQSVWIAVLSMKPSHSNTCTASFYSRPYSRPKPASHSFLWHWTASRWSERARQGCSGGSFCFQQDSGVLMCL